MSLFGHPESVFQPRVKVTGGMPLIGEAMILGAFCRRNLPKAKLTSCNFQPFYAPRVSLCHLHATLLSALIGLAIQVKQVGEWAVF